jgi:transcriptional regulator with XRE-family HTH domain
MEFSGQIKKIRMDNKLTQEQLAQKLTVSRQTISSWENNRNLPDLEMVVTVAKLFGLSLDQLILGDDTMTNKLVKDGNETKKARLNMNSILLMVIGGILFLIKGFSKSEIDSNGFLHEPLFFLIPLGYLFLFSGLVLFLFNLVKRQIKKFNNS